MIYDITRHATFETLPDFLSDAKALASPNLIALLVGNKADLSTPSNSPPLTPIASATAPLSTLSKQQYSQTAPSTPASYSTLSSSINERTGFDNQQHPDEGREVSADEASRWASMAGISVALETSALTGEGVDDVFERLARMILTKIELGEIDVDDSQNGIQYGDNGDWLGGNAGRSAGASTSGATRRRGGKSNSGRGGNWTGGLRDWEDVFRLDAANRKKGGCC